MFNQFYYLLLKVQTCWDCRVLKSSKSVGCDTPWQNQFPPPPLSIQYNSSERLNSCSSSTSPLTLFFTPSAKSAQLETNPYDFWQLKSAICLAYSGLVVPQPSFKSIVSKKFVEVSFTVARTYWSVFTLANKCVVMPIFRRKDSRSLDGCHGSDSQSLWPPEKYEIVLYWLALTPTCFYT